MALIHIQRAVRILVFLIVADRPLRIADVVRRFCHRAAECTDIAECASAGFEPQRRDGGDDLESRSRRIQAVARAIEQRSRGFAERQFLLQQIGRRHVHGGQQIARSPDPSPRPSRAPDAARRDARLRICAAFTCRAGGDREVHIALAVANPFDRGIVRLPAMPQQAAAVRDSRSGSCRTVCPSRIFTATTRARSS